MAIVKTLVAPGVYANHLEKPGTTLSASQTPSSIYPISRIADGRPGQMFIFPAIAADDYIEADLNQVVGGDGETWDGGEPVGPTNVVITGSGALTEETNVSKVVGGAGSGFDLANGADGNVEVIWEIIALADEPWKIELHAMTDNADSPYTAELYNPHTGKYLTSAGAWSATPQNFLSDDNTSLTQHALDFTVESFALCRRHFIKLLLRLHMDTAQDSRNHNYDDVVMYPGVNLAAVFGHNLDPLMVAELRSSDDAFNTDDVLEATFAVDVPTFYASLASTIRKRYWRIPKLTGTNSTLSKSVALGEAGLYFARRLQASPRLGDLEIAEFLPQDRVETPVSREQWTVKRGRYEQRVLRLAFSLSSSKQAQWRQEILRRTNDGVDPIVMVLDDTKTNSCVHARKPAEPTAFTRTSSEREQAELELVESSFGVDLE